MDLHERWIPRAMLGGAVLHLAMGLADPRTRELVDAGLVAALDGDPGREAIRGCWPSAWPLPPWPSWPGGRSGWPVVSRPAWVSGW
jgi:hypothetical protein